MNLNKLVQMAIEHQQQQEASKLQHNATFELLALTFIWTISPVQRKHELSLSMKEFINNVVADLFADMLFQPKGRGHINSEEIKEWDDNTIEYYF